MLDDENIAGTTFVYVGAFAFPGIIIIIASLALSSESNTIVVASLLAVPGLILAYLVTKLYSRFVIGKVKEAGEDFDKTDRS